MGFNPKALTPNTMKLTTKERRLIALLHDLPITARPFAALAAKLGESEEWVLGRLKRWERIGLVRKLAMVGRHRQMGYRANAMVCWQVPPRQVKAVGVRFSGLRAVSHCYQRRTYPSWRHNLYTMVHAKSSAELARLVAGMARFADGAPCRLLISAKEYKKTSPRYFMGEC